jgi:hypothetical protein
VSNIAMQPRGRRPWILTVFPVLAYTVLTILILGAVALGFGYAHAETRANAYAAAGPCHGSQQTGCILNGPVDLIDAGEKSGKSTTYWFEVAGDTVPDQTVDLNCSNDYGFFMAAQGLGTLTAKSWNGSVISLTYKGAGCGAGNAPTSKAQFWLMGLGAVGSVALGWLTLLSRRLVRDPRGKQIVGTASAPFYMNVLIFPILLGATGSHAAWFYVPAYAIGAVIAVPIAVAASRSRRRKQLQREQDAALRRAPSSGSGLRAQSPEIHWYGPEAGSAASGRSSRSNRSGRLRRFGRSNRGPGLMTGIPQDAVPGEKADAVTVAGALQERPRRRVGLIVNYTLLGLVAAGALTLLAFYIPAQANAFAYENAPICAGSATAGCITQETATVVDTGSYQSGNSSEAYWIEIQGPGIPETQYTLGGGCPVCVVAAVKPGSKITAQLWKGSLVELDADGNTAPGPTTPQKSAADLLGGFYALLGIVAFWLIVIATVKTRSTRRRHVYLCTGLVVLFGAGFGFAPLLAEAKPVLWALPLTLLISAVLIVPIYLLALAMSRRSARKRRARQDLVKERAKQEAAQRARQYRQQKQGRGRLP